MLILDDASHKGRNTWDRPGRWSPKSVSLGLIALSICAGPAVLLIPTVM